MRAFGLRGFLLVSDDLDLGEINNSILFDKRARNHS